MATISQLRPIIQTQLRSKADRVFYESTKGNPTFPYVVYSVNSYMYGEVITQAELEVNIYDNANDTSVIETLTDAIWEYYNHNYYIDADLAFTAYPNVRNNIDVADKQLHQRRLLITLRIC